MDEPILIKSWDELAKLPPSETYEIIVGDGSGWIKKIDSGEHDWEKYLSTHTFYGSMHKHSTEVLQGYGFNVIIDNWDKPLNKG